MQGEVDPHKQREIEWWTAFGEHGVTDDAVRASVAVFRGHFDDFERRLANQRYLLGDTLSLVDIAWFIYATRILSVGYPLGELHPGVARWRSALAARPEFAREVRTPAPIRLVGGFVRLRDRLTGGSLGTVAGL